MIARRLALAAVLLSAACRPHPVPSDRSAAVAPAVVTFPEGYRARAGATSPVFAHAVVSSESAISSVDGLAMLRACLLAR